MKPFTFIAAILAFSGLFGTAAADEPDTLRIGYQKGSDHAGAGQGTRLAGKAFSPEENQMG